MAGLQARAGPFLPGIPSTCDCCGPRNGAPLCREAETPGLPVMLGGHTGAKLDLPCSKALHKAECMHTCAHTHTCAQRRPILPSGAELSLVPGGPHLHGATLRAPSAPLPLGATLPPGARHGDPILGTQCLKGPSSAAWAVAWWPRCWTLLVDTLSCPRLCPISASARNPHSSLSAWLPPPTLGLRGDVASCQGPSWPSEGGPCTPATLPCHPGAPASRDLLHPTPQWPQMVRNSGAHFWASRPGLLWEPGRGGRLHHPGSRMSNCRVKTAGWWHRPTLPPHLAHLSRLPGCSLLPLLLTEHLIYGPRHVLSPDRPGFTQTLRAVAGQAVRDGGAQLRRLAPSPGRPWAPPCDPRWEAAGPRCQCSGSSLGWAPVPTPFTQAGPAWPRGCVSEGRGSIPGALCPSGSGALALG
ncbi:uncharacterized protein LOC110347407 [Heterocephalus glaber]|uniref:Uncharacterized protein LOC110347407 n=1 Tax=Heterocephalus glaber TaxID=10181 RepID=A0AAX6SDN8_HETGA|nr:uncharacterized protein LOC110347407 [Heterocephalus glaber]